MELKLCAAEVLLDCAWWKLLRPKSDFSVMNMCAIKINNVSMSCKTNTGS